MGSCPVASNHLGQSSRTPRPTIPLLHQSRATLLSAGIEDRIKRRTVNAVKPRMLPHVFVAVAHPVVVDTQILICVVHEAIPLRPALRIQRDLVIVRQLTKDRPIVDEFVFQAFSSECRLSKFVEPPIELIGFAIDYLSRCRFATSRRYIVECFRNRALLAPASLWTIQREDGSPPRWSISPLESHSPWADLFPPFSGKES